MEAVRCLWHISRFRPVLRPLHVSNSCIHGRPQCCNVEGRQFPSHHDKGNTAISFTFRVRFWVCISNSHYDSSKTLRYYRRAAVVFGDQSPVWKVKVYSYVNAQTNVYNYDEGGNTTGYSHASYLTRGESGNLNSGYMVYNGSWISGTWSSSGYTWL